MDTVSKKQESGDKILKRGTLMCPCCKNQLYFLHHYGIRIIEDGFYKAHCPNDKNKHFLIIPDKQ